MKKLILLMLFALTFLSGCSTYNVSPMPNISASEAPTKINNNGILFGAKPFTNGTEIESIFSYNLLDKGILPIYVTIDNNTNGELEFLRQRIELTISNGSSLRPVQAETATNGFGRNAMTESMLFGGIFSYQNATEFNDDMKRDWANKCFPEVLILPPSRIASKFLYFQVGNDYNPSGTTLNITYKNENAKEKVDFKF